MTFSGHEVVYTSDLPGDRRTELEELLFFHPQQPALVDAIVSSIDAYGQPRLVEADGRLSVEVDRLPGLQMLCALHCGTEGEALAGVVLYGRPSVERLVVVHLVVAHEYCSQGRYSDLLLPLCLLERVRTVAKCLKGVEAVVLPYGHGLAMRVI